MFIMSLMLYIANNKPKTHKILAVVGFLLTGASGAVLSARFGLIGDIPTPTWLIMKYAIWITMGIMTPVVVIKFNRVSKLLYWPWMILTFVIIAMAVYKPL
jgi:uncharacterized membrane protein